MKRSGSIESVEGEDLIVYLFQSFCRSRSDLKIIGRKVSEMEMKVQESFIFFG